MEGRCSGILGYDLIYWPRTQPNIYTPIFLNFFKVHMVILYIHVKQFIEFWIGLGAMKFFFLNFGRKNMKFEEKNKGRCQEVKMRARSTCQIFIKLKNNLFWVVKLENQSTNTLDIKTVPKNCDISQKSSKDEEKSLELKCLTRIYYKTSHITWTLDLYYEL